MRLALFSFPAFFLRFPSLRFSFLRVQVLSRGCSAFRRFRRSERRRATTWRVRPQGSGSIDRGDGRLPPFSGGSESPEDPTQPVGRFEPCFTRDGIRRPEGGCRRGSSCAGNRSPVERCPAWSAVAPLSEVRLGPLHGSQRPSVRSSPRGFHPRLLPARPSGARRKWSFVPPYPPPLSPQRQSRCNHF